MESPFLVKKDSKDKGLTEEDRRDLFASFVREDAVIMDILTALRELDLPDWRIVAGALYQTVWNRLTNRPQGHGIKDYDIAYFDADDLSYEAEDEVIKRVNAALPHLANRIEVRNQARVHLWYAEKFGGTAGDYPQLGSTDESLENYLCTTHAIAVRLEQDDRITIAAPFGLADIFSLTMRRCSTNPANQTNYTKKAKSMSRLWPELQVLDWHTAEPVRIDRL